MTLRRSRLGRGESLVETGDLHPPFGGLLGSCPRGEGLLSLLCGSAKILDFRLEGIRVFSTLLCRIEFCGQMLDVVLLISEFLEEGVLFESANLFPLGLLQLEVLLEIGNFLLQQRVNANEIGAEEAFLAELFAQHAGVLPELRDVAAAVGICFDCQDLGGGVIIEGLFEIDDGLVGSRAVVLPQCFHRKRQCLQRAHERLDGFQFAQEHLLELGGPFLLYEERVFETIDLFLRCSEIFVQALVPL